MTKFREFSSIFTLFTMTSAAIYGLIDLHSRGLPTWTMLNLIFTIIGGGGGLLWELLGDLNSKTGEIVECFRRANVGLVMASSLIHAILISVGEWNDLYTGIVAFYASFLYVESFLNINGQGGIARTLVALLIEHSVDIILYTFYSSQKTTFLIIGSALNFVSFLFAGNSFLFHGINTIVVIFSILGFQELTHIVPDPTLTLQSYSTILLSVLFGIIVVCSNPVLKNQLRFNINNSLWSAVYFGLLATPMPTPTYEEGLTNLNRIEWRDYEQVHINSKPLKIIAAAEVPKNQYFGEIFKKVDIFFKIIQFLDKYYPQANVKVLPKDKPRIDITQPVEYYVPSFIIRLGTRTRFTSPDSLLQWHSVGQSLSWMCLYGHCSTLLTRISPEMRQKYSEVSNCTHMIDLSWMEKYSAKDGFHRYGGKAFFVYDPNLFIKLKLVYITDSASNGLVYSDPENKAFMDCLRRFLSSTGIVNVAGFHLAGIHMFYNLVSLSLYNSFDAESNRSQPHPFRLVMLIHFFNHVLVEEKTTAHLMDKGGVFNQIFALDHDSICNFVGDYFRERVILGEDADLDSRAQVLCDGSNPDLPHHSQVEWQYSYRKIFNRYGQTVANAIWKNDEEVESDIEMKNFYQILNSSLTSGTNKNLPERYNQLANLEGVSRFIADTIFTVTVLHEVFGTRMPEYGTDYRLFYSQMAKDDLPPTVEEYNSMILVTAATSRVKFPKLLSIDPAIPFKRAPEASRSSLIDAFNQMKIDLRILEIQWTSTPDQRYINTEFQRVVPSDLECAAGY